MALDEQDIEIIRGIVADALKPKVPVCGKPVLQDTSCRLPWTHNGLHIDQDGVWRCPWCNKDAFWGHSEDCPANEPTKEASGG